MLRLEAAQMEALRRAQQELLQGRLLQRARQEFGPELAGESDELLLGRVRRALQRGGAYQLDTEQDLYRFLAVTLVLGETFDARQQTAWAREILLDPDVPDPSQRMQRLFQEVLLRLEQREAGSPDADEELG